MNYLRTLLASPHTTWSAVAIIAASALEELGPGWFPSKAEMCVKTGKWLARIAMAYALVNAQDAKPVDNSAKPVDAPKV